MLVSASGVCSPPSTRINVAVPCGQGESVNELILPRSCLVNVSTKINHVHDHGEEARGECDRSHRFFCGRQKVHRRSKKSGSGRVLDSHFYPFFFSPCKSEVEDRSNRTLVECSSPASASTFFFPARQTSLDRRSSSCSERCRVSPIFLAGGRAAQFSSAYIFAPKIGGRGFRSMHLAC